MRLRAVLSLIALLPCAVIAAPSDDIKSLIDQGKAADAYQLGIQATREPSDELFDYYFGVAAVDSDHVAEGVEILKRYVDRHSDDSRARLELGRGYFLLEDNRRAREEFEAVKKTNPPPEVVANIDIFLEAIRQRETQRQAVLTGYVEAGGGHDTNVNGGVSNSNIIMPVLGNVIVDQTGLRAGDNFGRVAAGAQVIRPLSGGLGLFAGANYDARAYSRQTSFDLTTYNVAAGLSYTQGANLVRATLSWNSLEVDYSRFRDIRGLSGEWQYKLNPAQFIFLSGQVARFAYAGTNSIRDADFNAVGAGFRHAWDTTWQPAVTLSLNASEERNVNQRDDLSNERYVARASIDFKPHPRWLVTGGITYSTAHYSQPDAILGISRQDDYYAIDFSAAYMIMRDLSVRGELSLVDNHSNVALYAYRRNIAGVNLRYEFR